VLTLLGLLCNVVAFYLATTHVPDLRGEAPRWVYFSMSALLFTYMILDNTDGKQAVRTGSSSPLGELFDHGVDSCVIAMGTIMSATCFQAGPWGALWLAAPGFIAFYMAHWQEYFNHFLELGMLNGPTEAEVLAIILFALTGFFGPALWSSPVTVLGITFAPADLLIVAIFCVAVFTAVQSLYQGLNLAQKNRIPTSVALSQLIPLAVTWLIAAVWIFHSPDLYAAHPHLFLTMLNLLFAFLVVNCIVQRMCELPYKFFYLPIGGLMFGAFNSLSNFYTGSPIIREDFVLYALWVYYFATFVHLVKEVMVSFCDQLHINTWTIPYPNKGTKSS